MILNLFFNKVNKAIDLLRKFQSIFRRHSLISIYKIFIRPHLDYGDVIYNPTFNISPLDKFAYLQSILSPSASECISGQTTTAENYNEVVELLNQRYGCMQLLINAHMQQFIYLPVTKSVNDVKGLRKLYEKVQSSVRNLKTLWTLIQVLLEIYLCF